MPDRVLARKEWQLARCLYQADRPLAAAWWAVLVLRGLLPAVLAIVMGALVGAVQRGSDLTAPLTAVGIVFILLQVLAPIHQALSANLGDRTAAWLYDRLTEACLAPAGIGHLEDPRLAADLTVARDFDRGMTGPPLSISMDFIAAGLIELVAGVAQVGVLAAYRWWAPVVLGGAWGATHWLLRESAIWRTRNTEEVRGAQRDADYAYRLAVDPPAAKELRLFGLAGWTLERFVRSRTRLHQLQYEATRLRERPLLVSVLLVIGANLLVFLSLRDSVLGGELSLGALVVFAQSALGASMIAFGGLSWALDGASAPVAAVLRLGPAMRRGGQLAAGTQPATGLPSGEIRFRNVAFGYPGGALILEDFDLTIPAGTSLAIVGANGAGKTTLAKLLCRLYDPVYGGIEVDGIDIRTLDIQSWRSRLTGVFQDFTRFQLSLRDNVAPSGASDEAVERALALAGAQDLAALDVILARGYEGGTELSGGQWQRIALARALCAVELGAGIVLLDEPTAQLDVRGEVEVFNRILTRTRGCTRILISHRFSTVRQADRICVMEQGRVAELGSHEELMALDGHYRRMFELQAQRFLATENEEGLAYDSLA